MNMYYHIVPYMTMYNCSTHAVMNKFCGSKWTKWFKKAQKRVHCSETMLKKS